MTPPLADTQPRSGRQLRTGTPHPWQENPLSARKPSCENSADHGKLRAEIWVLSGAPWQASRLPNRICQSPPPGGLLALMGSGSRFPPSERGTAHAADSVLPDLPIRQAAAAISRRTGGFYASARPDRPIRPRFAVRRLANRSPASRIICRLSPHCGCAGRLYSAGKRRGLPAAPLGIHALPRASLHGHLHRPIAAAMMSAGSPP